MLLVGNVVLSPNSRIEMKVHRHAVRCLFQHPLFYLPKPQRIEGRDVDLIKNGACDGGRPVAGPAARAPLTPHKMLSGRRPGDMSKVGFLGSAKINFLKTSSKVLLFEDFSTICVTPKAIPFDDQTALDRREESVTGKANDSNSHSHLGPARWTASITGALPGLPALSRV